MKERRLLALVAVATLTALTACSKPADNTVETKSQATTTGPQGEVQTKKETKQVGDTLEAKTETKSKNDTGTVTTNVETFVGTVTVYEAGKKIEVLTGENARHSFALDGKDAVVDIAGAVQVGTRVRLVQEKGDRSTRVSVTVEGGKS